MSVGKICQGFNVTRDAYYKRKRRMKSKETQHTKVIDLAIRRRQWQPREGTEKVYRAIKPQLEALGIKLGRDKFYELMRDHNMLIRPRRKYVNTTNSRHRFHKYDNLVKDFVPTAKNQLWVSDITYIRTGKSFCYLALITDAYSRKIVGYDISNSLELEGSLRALKKALKSLPAGSKPIHHSDRGIQYCSYQYTNVLKKHGLKISMASKGDCYENAMAERVNGILKQEFFLDENFINLEHAKKTSEEAIKIYNNMRLHMALAFKTPNQVHLNAN